MTSLPSLGSFSRLFVSSNCNWPTHREFEQHPALVRAIFTMHLLRTNVILTLHTVYLSRWAANPCIPVCDVPRGVVGDEANEGEEEVAVLDQAVVAVVV